MAANLMGKRIVHIEVRTKYRRNTALDTYSTRSYSEFRFCRSRRESVHAGRAAGLSVSPVSSVSTFPSRARIVVDNHSRSEKQLSIKMSDTRRDDHTCLAFILPRCWYRATNLGFSTMKVNSDVRRSVGRWI